MATIRIPISPITVPNNRDVSPSSTPSPPRTPSPSIPPKETHRKTTQPTMDAIAILNVLDKIKFAENIKLHIPKLLHGTTSKKVDKYIKYLASEEEIDSEEVNILF